MTTPPAANQLLDPISIVQPLEESRGFILVLRGLPRYNSQLGRRDSGDVRKALNLGVATKNQMVSLRFETINA